MFRSALLVTGALLLAACPKSETAEGAQQAVPASHAAVAAPPDATGAAKVVQVEPAARPRVGAPPAKDGAGEGEQGRTPQAGVPPDACLDRWLAQRGLNAYGDSEGTMYLGGTPLFDESSGKTVSRAQYVFEKHPGAKAACASGQGK